jgi:glycosyltransferase involved in cell wall biosynthesis
VYLAPNRWDGPRQRTQHLTAGFARTRPVIFVEPAAYTLPGLLRRRLRGERTGPLWWRSRQVSDNLLVYSPPPTLPGNLHLRSLNSSVHHIAWRGMRRVLRDSDSGHMDVVVGWPPAFELARRLRPRRLIYDCLDLFAAFRGGLRGRLLASLEGDLARTAWGVVVTSRALERLWSTRHPRVERIPNGVDLAVFGPGASSPALPPDLAGLPRPRLGYIGTVGQWVDLPLLVHVARQRPRCSVVLVGPLERGLLPSARPENLHLLGERPYGSLAGYLAAMDVLLIPFGVTELTHAANPIKLYEYCASGKPIVATPIEEVAAHQGVCRLGAGRDSFLAAVDDALYEVNRPDPAGVMARRAVALANTWADRVDAFSSLLDEGRE